MKKQDTLKTIIQELSSSKHTRSSFYLTLEHGRLTVGWLNETPGEDKVRTERYINLGDAVSIANVKQSIEAKVKK